MRRPRDIDSELRALEDKARQLRARKVEQLGEIVVATRADALPLELLAGALLDAAAATDDARKEAWRASGAAFFQRTPGAADRARRRGGKAVADAGRAEPADADPGAA